MNLRPMSVQSHLFVSLIKSMLRPIVQSVQSVLYCSIQQEGDANKPILIISNISIGQIGQIGLTTDLSRLMNFPTLDIFIATLDALDIL